MRLSLLTVFLIISLSCKEDTVDPNFGTGDIKIRIWNDTAYHMKDIFVNTGGGENDYGELKARSRSSYFQFVNAYRYAFVSFKIDGKAYTIQPVDYVGEEPLEKGKYTYRLSVDNLNSTYAILEFIED